MKKLIKKPLAAIFLLLLASSCVSRLDKHGYMFDLSDHELVQEGVTTKERLLKMMGSPTFISDLDADEAWVYYEEDVDNYLFFKPTIKSREIVIVRFKGTDTVREIKKLSLSDENEKLSFTSNQTPVEGHKVGWFKSFFSNVGQVKPIQ